MAKTINYREYVQLLEQLYELNKPTVAKITKSKQKKNHSCISRKFTRMIKLRLVESNKGNNIYNQNYLSLTRKGKHFIFLNKMLIGKEDEISYLKDQINKLVTTP
jgi:hypothetical protein